MFAIIIGLIVIALVVTLLLKGYYPQAILFMGGVVLLTCTAIFGWGDLLNAKQTTNFIGFDIFKVFSTGFSSRIAGLGLTLMAIGGFSRYMEHVGASAALFSVFEKPLKLIKSPYVLLGASFLVSQIMVIFVPSHAGLALLLMVTLYPILIRSGVSPMSALGVIGCAQFVDVGPGSGNAILAAQTAGVDVSEYFVYYQLPLFVGVVIILTFVHMFVQRCRPHQIRLHGHADHCSQRRWLRSGNHGDCRRRSGVALLLHHGFGQRCVLLVCSAPAECGACHRRSDHSADLPTSGDSRLWPRLFPDYRRHCGHLWIGRGISIPSRKENIHSDALWHCHYLHCLLPVLVLIHSKKHNAGGPAGLPHIMTRLLLY